MNLRRRKSKPQQAADLLASYVKLKAVSKTAKGAKKAAKGTAVYQTAKRTPLVKRIPIVLLGAAAATFAAIKLLGGGDDDQVPAHG
ncbi:MAG TPA: hypothetical protein VH276_13880 [Solirubrobacteraceae bacterium]|jgi:hypothetical protein|nr:hypothetical protein [Solirubrobacteraceae bacterium]